MLKYLKSLHQLKLTSLDGLVVTGNQSADMDSCCSALITAYLQTANGIDSIPLIDIPKSDLKLRRDIEYVFKNLNIDPSWLLFSDDLSTSPTTNLFLVDHNAPTISGTVRGVLDHHAIEDPSMDFSHLDPNILKKSGSCMSVILNYFSQFANTKELFESDAVLAPLALAPILQDTNNFTNKVEDEDKQALKFLSQFSFNLFSPSQNFAVMNSEKKDISGLSMSDLLRKDYKQWGTIGISSLPKLFSKIEKKTGESVGELANSIKDYASTEKLDLMIALTSGVVEKVYHRELAFFGPIEFNILERCPDLGLKLTGVVNGVQFYEQTNTTASRKQVAPLVKESFAAFKAN